MVTLCVVCMLLRCSLEQKRTTITNRNAFWIMPDSLLLYIGLPLFPIVAGLGALWLLASYSSSHRPALAGKRKFEEDSKTPNYVSSLTQNPSRRIKPIQYEGDPEASWNAAKKAVQALPGTEIISTEADYLYAECRSQVFGFVDDLELKINRERNLIHVRSASRVGYSDMGANRKRVEQLRQSISERTQM